MFLRDRATAALILRPWRSYLVARCIHTLDTYGSGCTNDSSPSSNISCRDDTNRDQESTIHGRCNSQTNSEVVIGRRDGTGHDSSN